MGAGLDLNLLGRGTCFCAGLTRRRSTESPEFRKQNASSSGPDVCLGGELVLPLPDLAGLGGGLPDLPDAGAPWHGDWEIGQNCPSIGAGGCRRGAPAASKKVGLQAYHIINNVASNLLRVPAGGLDDFCRPLVASGVHVPAWNAAGLTSALTAERLPTVKSQRRRTSIP